MLQHRFFTVLIVCATALLVFQCKKGDDIVDSLTHFDFSTDYVVKVPASPMTPFPVSVMSPEIKTTSDTEFDNNNTRADMVERISLKGLDLSVEAPSGGTLSFLKSVDIHAMADGLPSVRVAYKDQVPANVGSTLSLDVTNVELKEYFKKATYVLRVTVTTDEATTQEYAIRANGTFFVDAKVLGQ
jgi:hypothetical protein